MSAIKDRPDVQTVANLRRLGFTVEREETIVAAEKPFAVRDQTPIDWLRHRDRITQAEYDAAKKIQRLWRVCKSGPKAVRAANWDRVQNGSHIEEDAVYRIEAQAELTALFGKSAGNVKDPGVLNDRECMAVISVVVFDEPPAEWASRSKVRRSKGQEIVKEALGKAVKLWRMH